MPSSQEVKYFVQVCMYIYIYNIYRVAQNPGTWEPGSQEILIYNRKFLKSTSKISYSSSGKQKIIVALSGFPLKDNKRMSLEQKVLWSHISCNLEVSISNFFGASPPNTHLQTYSTSLSSQLNNSIATHARSNNFFLIVR